MRYLILGVTLARGPDGEVVHLGGPRLRALLAALALRVGRAVPVRDLIDDVYGSEPPYDAPAALQALVSRLRRALGKDVIASAPGGYRLDVAREDVDVHVFERQVADAAALLRHDGGGDADSAAALLRSALSLWRGPALADLADDSTALRPEARRLEAHRLDALRSRVEADLRRGATGTLVPELTELTAAHPFDEGFRAQLIRALRAEGRRADALAAYEDGRRALADGLGTDPGPDLQSLYAQLLATTPIQPPVQPPVQAPTTPPSPPPRTAPAPAPVPLPVPAPGNIRPRLTSFIGREPELALIRDDLARFRLVTLTGPGGTGKTRLAEVAATADGAPAWLVELARLDAPLEDSTALPGAVLSALGLRETNLITREGQTLQDDPTAVLVEHLADRPLLLVLDNCEHVIDAVAELAETLLTRCPELRILATSREPLGVPGEAVRPVEPLPPDPAHQLFAERARTVRPDFAPGTPHLAGTTPAPDTDVVTDTDVVAEICRRLDGLPLAIELAAARLRLLTPRQIADRLDDRFRLLNGGGSGSRTVLPRQQTLRAVVDWSWDLLDEDERTLLRMVSVFAGGWDLGAAEALTADAARTLGALVDKSLVIATPADDGEMRYRLLETIHEYASERAAETPDVLARAERAHTAHFTDLVERAEPRLRSGDQLPWIARLEADLDNIRAALHRAAVTAGDERAALRLVFGMGWFWWLRNYRPEGLSWVERTLALGDDTDDEGDPRYWPRMRLRMLEFFLAGESHASGDIRDAQTAVAQIRHAREAFSRPGPEAARFPGLLWPITTYLTDEPDDIHAMLDAAVDNCRHYGGDWELAVSLMFRTHMTVDMPGGLTSVTESAPETSPEATPANSPERGSEPAPAYSPEPGSEAAPGDRPEVRPAGRNRSVSESLDADLRELRTLARRVGDRWIRAQVAGAAAEAGMLRGRYEDAGAAYEEALGLAREVGAHAEAPFLLARLAELAHRTGDSEAAEKVLDEASAEADRYHVHDSQFFIRFLRAMIALERGDLARARLMIDAARPVVEVGSAPPHFIAALMGLDARVAAQESPGPDTVRRATEALRMAQRARCAEFVVTQIAEWVAATLALAGELPLAARVLGAVDTWRAGIPPSVPQRYETDAVEARALAALGPQGYEAERAAGAVLTLAEVVALLDGYLEAAAPGLDDSGVSRS